MESNETRMTTTLQLKQGSRKPRVLDGHPWVFAGEIVERLPEAFDGQSVELLTPRGRSLGTGIYSHASQIAWRRFAGPGASWDERYLRAAIEGARRRRSSEPVQRMVWSEADDLPGLVVDRFDDLLVVQSLSKGVESQLETIGRILLESVEGISDLVFRNDAPSRRLEGLPSEVRTFSGKTIGPRWFQIRGLWYELDLMHGQKTGFYLDQRDEHERVASWAQDRRVLDAFCNQGAFALQCARRGSREVTALDSSAEAIEGARRNAGRNGLQVDFQVANVFDWLTEHKHEKFDLIVLDPPPFAPNRKAVEGALRGYKQLHLRALRMLTPGGVLATYSCSQHISYELFLQTLTEAAVDTHRDTRLLTLTGQPLDHPVRLGFPESGYLKGAVVRVE